MKVNILGTDYDIVFTTSKEDVRLCNADGYCDHSTKRIAIETDFNSNDPDAIGDLDIHKRKLIRHELVHAFLFESGLNSYARDETLVDWIAWHMSRLVDAMLQAGGL